MMQGVGKAIKLLLQFYLRCWRVMSWWLPRTFFIVSLELDDTADLPPGKECGFLQEAHCHKMDYWDVYCVDYSCSYTMPVIIFLTWVCSFVVSLGLAYLLNRRWRAQARVYRVKQVRAAQGSRPQSEVTFLRLKGPWLMIQRGGVDAAPVAAADAVCPFSQKTGAGNLRRCQGCGTFVAKELFHKPDKVKLSQSQRDANLPILYFSVPTGAIGACCPGCLVYYRARIAVRSWKTVVGSVVLMGLILGIFVAINGSDNFTSPLIICSVLGASFTLIYFVTMIGAYHRFNIVEAFAARVPQLKRPSAVEVSALEDEEKDINREEGASDSAKAPLLRAGESSLPSERDAYGEVGEEGASGVV